MKKRLFEKKQWMMLSLVAALGLAVYLNYYFSRDPLQSAPVQGQPGVSSDGSAPDGEPTTGTTGGSHLGEASFVSSGGDTDKDASGTPAEEKPVSGTVPAGADDHFSRARSSRATAREEAVRVLKETIGSAGASAQQQADANKKAQQIADEILLESDIENLISAKGFSDCLVFIDGDSCSVVVRAEKLTARESLMIMELVTGKTAISAKNVQISAAQG